MELIRYLIIGIVQGISEVLPISSSAHLVLIQELLGIKDDNLTLEVFLHLASLVSILFLLRNKLINLIGGFIKYVFLRKKEYELEFKICCYIVISTIPIVVFTILFKEQINMIGSNILVIGLLLIINGVLLLTISKIKGVRTLKDFNVIDALIIGCFQCIGIFPGISRSGSCLYGAYSRKIEKNSATDYAFLLFVPAVVGATVLEFGNFTNTMVNDYLWMYIIVFLVTSIVTFLAFKLLLKIVKEGKLKYFGYYCIFIGVISIMTMLIK